MRMLIDESKKYPRLLRNQHASEDPLWQTNGTTPKLAEAVPAESEGISALNVWQRIFFVRSGLEDAVSSFAETARVQRSTLAQIETTPKLAEAVPAESEGISAFNVWLPHFLRAMWMQGVVLSPVESEQPRAEINKQDDTGKLFQLPSEALLRVHLYI